MIHCCLLVPIDSVYPAPPLGYNPLYPPGYNPLYPPGYNPPYPPGYNPPYPPGYNPRTLRVINPPSLPHQIGLEGGEVLRHRHALLGALHESAELGGDVDGLPDDALHCVLELGRMGGLQKDARLAGT